MYLESSGVLETIWLYSVGSGELVEGSVLGWQKTQGK